MPKRTTGASDRMLAIMRRPKGATIDELAKAGGWCTGAIGSFITKRRAAGVQIKTIEDARKCRGEPTRYRIGDVIDRAADQMRPGGIAAP